MAFNPLHMFRKRQKVMLAILTIGTMILFVLGSGVKGDLFSRDWWGGRKSEETYLKKKDGSDFLMNGKPVGGSDLSALSLERRITSAYMRGAYETALRSVITDLTSYQKVPAQDVTAMVRQGELQRQMMQLRPSGNPFSPTKGDYYTGFLPYLSQHVDELLDFQMWKDEAKRLGINYLSDADIEHLVKDETFNLADVQEALASAKSSLGRDHPNLTVADIYNALRNEFAVRQAKTAVLGSDPLWSMVSGGGLGDAKKLGTAMTPYERFEEYRKNRAADYFSVMTLPVADFLPKVTQKPTEEELTTLYDRYKDKEYSPDRPKPGFKEPRRIYLEYVSGRSDSPYYHDQAHVLSALPISFLPTPLVSLSAQDLAVLTAYYNKTANVFGSDPSFQLPSLTDPNFVLPFYRSLYQPENVASLVGMLANGSPMPVITGVQGSAVATNAKEQAAAVAREINKRIAVGTSLLLSSANPLTITTPCLWARVTQEKQYLPLDDVRSELVREAEARYAHNLLALNLAKLQKELEAKRFKPKEAREWLAKTLPEFGLAQHVVVVDADGKNKPLGQYELNADPQLQSFKEAYLRQNSKRDPKAEQFAEMFFDKDVGGKNGSYVPKEWPRGALNTESSRPGSDEETFLWWKTEEDKPGYVPSFKEIRPKVEEAWRWQRAQELAESEAEKLKSEAQATGGDSQKLKDLAKKHNLKEFQLDAVAKLIRQEAALPGGKSYKRYEFPPDTLPYSDAPTQQQVLEKLVALEKKGDSVVFHNQPKGQFYIATVYDRLDPDVDGFYRVYRDASKSAAIQDQLFEILDAQRREEVRQKLEQQLRSGFANVNDKGFYDLDADQKQEIEKRLAPSRGG